VRPCAGWTSVCSRPGGATEAVNPLRSYTREFITGSLWRDHWLGAVWISVVAVMLEEVSPPLSPADIPGEAEFGRLACVLLRELAAQDPAIAERAHALGIDLAGDEAVAPKAN